MIPRVAVVGDEFIDNYYLGDTHRLSPEAPIPVVSVHKFLTLPGGAGNVVANLESFGVEVVTIPKGFVPCPVKNRLLVGTHQLARWDQNDTTPPITSDMVKYLLSSRIDLLAIIISDYGKGSITDETIEAIGSLGLPTFIDSKRSPRDFDLIGLPTFFPNQLEYDAHYLDYALQPSVILKRSANGIQHQRFGRIVEEHAAWANRVVSVCGAGDTVLAAYVFAILTNRPALPFANAAAAVVVGKPFTATVTVEEVDQVLWELMKYQEDYHGV